MQALEIMIRHIRREIPKEILEIFFKPTTTQQSLDACILDEIVENQLLPDCNIVAGKITEIILQPKWIIPSRVKHSVLGGEIESFSLYRIPPEARQEKNITKVLYIDYPYGTYYGNNGLPGMVNYNYGGNTVGNLGDAVLDSHTYASKQIFPTPILEEGNIIKLIPHRVINPVTAHWRLHCRLEYDSEFTNLNSNAIMSLAKMAVSLTKWYISTNSVVAMSEFVVRYGQELGVVKDLIESYASEKEVYQEMLNEFHKTASINDPEALRRALIHAV